ncbi:MAG: ABC transporter ATP-binding protein [Defluviitaleaceae bacterium]|nr:ABC transporter ATP-binding protein [Defluviitaleaceae bacterium]MCL2275360.1 ABC transporter ATP-binding protein [Defluviitaleaceae bacterium]
MADYIIETLDIEKIYGNKAKTHALRGVSLRIPRGGFACIVGASGHGKSTLLQLIGALDKPTAGRILLEGTDISAMNDNAISKLRGEKIGFVFQAYNLLDNLTARENIETAMLFSSQKPAKNRAEALLALVGLADKTNAKPNELSGGQLQRIAIARALANDPPILLMDEPTGNLDSQSEQEVLQHIFNVHKAGKTVVMVTHNREIAAKAQLVFEIHDGKLKEGV